LVKFEKGKEISRQFDHDGYVTPAYQQAGTNHENNLLVKVRKPVSFSVKG